MARTERPTPPRPGTLEYFQHNYAKWLERHSTDLMRQIGDRQTLSDEETRLMVLKGLQDATTALREATATQEQRLAQLEQRLTQVDGRMAQIGTTLRWGLIVIAGLVAIAVLHQLLA